MAKVICFECGKKTSRVYSKYDKNVLAIVNVCKKCSTISKDKFWRKGVFRLA